MRWHMIVCTIVHVIAGVMFETWKELAQSETKLKTVANRQLVVK